MESMHTKSAGDVAVGHGKSDDRARHTVWGSNSCLCCEIKHSLLLFNTHTQHNRFTALLEFVRDHPGEQLPER